MLTIQLYIPWVSKKCETKDLYEKLSNAENSRFIFNDSINNTKYLKDNTNNLGLIHTFSERNELCVVTATITISDDKIVSVSLNLKDYKEYKQEEKPNIYFRFWIKPESPFILMRKKGISKTTIIYDIKINERRNIPSDKIDYFSDKVLYVYSFPHRVNMKELIDLKVLAGVNDPPRGFKQITKEQFNNILKATKSDESFIVD